MQKYVMADSADELMPPPPETFDRPLSFNIPSPEDTKKIMEKLKTDPSVFVFNFMTLESIYNNKL